MIVGRRVAAPFCGSRERNNIIYPFVESFLLRCGWSHRALEVSETVSKVVVLVLAGDRRLRFVCVLMLRRQRE